MAEVTTFYNTSLGDTCILLPPNFSLSSFLPTLKISWVLHEWLKSWNFGGLCLRVPHFVPPNFVIFYLSFIITYPKNFMYLKGLKSLSFGGPRLENPHVC